MKQAPLHSFDVVRQEAEKYLVGHGISSPVLMNALQLSLAPDLMPDEETVRLLPDETRFLKNGRLYLGLSFRAKILNALSLKRPDFVLLIGCPSAYVLASLSPLILSAVALEKNDAAVSECDRYLRLKELDNAAVFRMDNPTDGMERQAPFDVIFVHDPVPEVPKNLIGQLACGGRITFILRRKGAFRIFLGVKRKENTEIRHLFDAPLPAAREKELEEFIF